MFRVALVAGLLLGSATFASAATVTSVHDYPSTLQTSQGANHTITLVTPSGAAEGSTITLTVGTSPGQFTVSTLFSNVSVTVNGTPATVGSGCVGVQKLGFSLVSNVITLQVCAGNGGAIPVAATVAITIANQTIVNPASTGTYYITIGGTFGDFGSIALPISTNANVSVSATITGAVSNSNPTPVPVADTAAPVVSAVTVSSITATGATISWTTDRTTSSVVDYGLTSSYGSSLSDGSAVTSHTAVLTGLAQGTGYHFNITATATNGHTATSGDQTFMTLDLTPPVLTNILVTDVGQSAATITWTTDEPATSAVDYGLTASYGATATDATLTTTHSVALTGLTHTTTYHFHVRSSDASLNEATSADATFDTLANPPPGNVSVLTTTPGDHQNALTWVNPTDPDLAVVRVVACPTSAPLGPTDVTHGCTVVFDALGTSYTQTGLTNGTTYYYGVYPRDTINQYATGALTSGRPVGAPVDVSNLVATPGSSAVHLSWTNPSNPSPTAVRVIACPNGYPTGANDTANGCTVVSEASDSSFSHTGLVNDKVWYYGVYTKNSLGQFSTGRLVSATPTAVNAPPGPVSGLLAVSGNGQVSLSWTNPSDLDLAAVRLLACPHGYPSAADDASCITLVDGTVSSFTQTGLTNGVSVFYGVYARDNAGQYSTGSFVTGTPSAASAVCGDGTCNGFETQESCPVDCGVPSTVCGNQVCEAGETAVSCPADCGLIPSCGNGLCDAGETTASCPADCPVVPPTTAPVAAQITLDDVKVFARSSKVELPAQGKTFNVLSGTSVAYHVRTSQLPVQPQRLQLSVGSQTYNLSPQTSADGTTDYVADVPLPAASGSLATAVSLFYADGTTQTLPFISTVQGLGLVYEVIGQQNVPVSGAIVTLLEGAGGSRAWDGTPFTESNPMITGANGTFGWYVPGGTYRIRAEKVGYDTVVAPSFSADSHVAAARIRVRVSQPFIPAVVESIKQLQENPTVQKAADTSAPAIAVVAVANTAALAVSFNLLAYLHYITTAPVLLFSRRKRKGYGVVYNAITKVPVDLAIVRLYRIDEANPTAPGQLVASRVTDKGGRYFFLAQPGSYRLMAVKPQFSYPSDYLSKVKDDGLFMDVYHNEPIKVVGSSASITANIPMDPAVREETPAHIRRMAFLRRAQNAVAVIGNIGAVGVLILRPSVFTAVMAVGQIAVYALVQRLAAPHKPVNWGIVYDHATGRPLANVVARVFEPKYNKLLETAITDSRGRFTFLLGPNEYYAVFEHAGFAPHTLRPIDYTKRSEPSELAEKIGLEVAGTPSVPPNPPPPSAVPPPAPPSPPAPAVSAPSAPPPPASAIDLMLAPPEPTSPIAPPPPAPNGDPNKK